MSIRLKETLKNLSYLFIPALGVLFLMWYIKAAGADVVYSDYIRIVAEYLEDVDDPSKMLVPDILTRIPATYLARFINVSSFAYSVNFDRVLSVFGIGIMALVLAAYFYRHAVALQWQLCIYLVLFSLIKWEVLLNGTAWAHVVSIGLFYISYLLLDRLWRGESGPWEEFLLLVMPLLLLLTAGEYIASYSVTMLLLSLFGMLMGGVNSWSVKRGQSLFRAIFASTFLAVALYMASRSFAVWEHAGAAESSLTEAIMEQPLLLPLFFFKSFAGAVIGGETIAAFFGSHALPEGVVAAVGVIMFLAYIFAFMLYLRSELFEVTIFPLALLLSGFINHVLVTVSRWIFLSSDYALSSRYSCQFMVGITGMLLIFAMYSGRTRELRRLKPSTRSFMKACTCVVAALIITGNLYTTVQEIKKAAYREENYTAMYEAVADYKSYEAEELAAILEWGKDAETMYKALYILEENHLNVFSRNGI